MKSLLTRIWRDDSGQDMAEYAIVLGVIAVVTVGVITLFGGQVQTLWKNATTALTTPPAS
ncbi:MAG: Flp family type IVb pilin [Terriglobales bacterium]